MLAAATACQQEVSNPSVQQQPPDRMKPSVVALPTAAAAGTNRDLQLLFHHLPTGNVTYWWVRDGAMISTASYGTVPTTYNLIGAGDLTHDAVTDLVWHNTQSNSLLYWPLTSSDAYNGSAPLGPVTPQPWRPGGVGDFNRDNHADIVWHQSATGSVVIWIMSGTSISQSKNLGTVPAGWHLATVGDLDNDGYSDLLWEHTSTGSRLAWLMNGTAIRESKDLAPVPTNWTMAAVGDWDDDGKNDILWQDPSAGTIIVWVMNGTTWVRSVSPGSPPPPWRLRAVRRSAVVTPPNPCQVSYSATNVSYDEEMAEYGIGEDTETVQFCETWVGNDYAVRITQQSSTGYESQESDAARTFNYAAGQATGYDVAAGYITSEAVGATAFEFVNATPAEIQASYDDPYYGVTTPACADPMQIRCDDNPAYARGVAPTLGADVAPAGQTTTDASGTNDARMRKKLRHNLKRLGIRALVDDLDEVGRGLKGERRFKGRRGDVDVTIDVDPATELIAAEEHVSSRGTIKATHTWSKTRGRYVRARTETTHTYTDGSGRARRSTSVLTAANVVWAGR